MRPARPGLAWLAALTVLAAAIRFRDLGRLGFWYDEISLWLYSLTGEPPTPFEPPLMAWLLYAAMWWLGTASAWVSHALPALLGTAAVPVTFWCARRLGESPATALVAAAFVAVSPMAVYYSREGRPYALFMLLTAGLLVALVRALETDGWRAWLAYAVLLALCGLTQMLTVELALAFGLFALVAVRPWRRLVAFAGATALGATAGLFWAAARYTASGGSAIAINQAFDGLYPHGPLAFFRTVLVNFGPGPVRAVFGGFSWADALALVFLGLFAAGAWRLATTGRRPLLGLLALFFAVPLAVKYLTLGLRGSWDWVRYVSPLLIPFMLVCSAGWEALRARLGTRSVAVAAAALLAAVGVRAASLPEREDYRQYRDIARYLEANAPVLDGVIVLPRHVLGSGDERITNIYFQQKRDGLPVFQVAQGELHHVELAASTGGLAGIARPNGQAQVPSGRYAVLYRSPLADCREMGTWVKGMDVAGGTAAVLPGMAVCELGRAG